ncbi:MAG: glutamine--tRNA ligase/YqeY domain fusion protein [Ignavibacteria bacterium]|nr:glutamine--tRNA ligase/YqeY domain fusion protein [Ignavibacteria bacterium]MBT8382718.1 glutamine--tRNA ligase/YqeY domain fusion protein [Ignavibacteria bacterium]MBT8390988.1 glutamine--tRNA ligase/YqeY domain fusion protein [Ignavibacteria bacterium]NNJ54396.1 glutamine--tRNA ligase/YqeY domain fusion protein [Ignavibacteriaceae bacterium]NNL22587.1 glutamine--tRNA ligase/YqeY domain fusion protein [Ignavibacteriaceae bacterium]
MDKSQENNTIKATNFIREIIEEDLRSNKHNGRVHTRFPPEPNGYLHIGHAKSIFLNFGLANEYNGHCNLRFDDTNPTKEEQEYVDSIKEDLRWLGFEWGDREYYASDYFDTLYEYAVKLIKNGKAYIDSLSADQIREYRGTPTEPGKESPCRDRSVGDNLKLFEEMKNGKYKEGEHVLRAKIDMSSPNLNLRDPVLYRILHKHHHRTKDKWCIYPMYDMAHGQSDSIERITHSLCTLEFENHRPLYDWLINELEIFPPRQIEFARLNLNYTIMSKRKLLQLVNEKSVDGWDDPRMPTISGLRRRGYTPESIKNFSEAVGIAKRENIIDVSLLEFSVREDLNKKAQRVMAVLNPIKVTITNYPENKTEELEAVNNPEDLATGKRKIPFGKEIFIEENDFMENPPRKFFRLSPGKEVRLRYGYIVKCIEVIKDIHGKIIELKCTYDPETKSGSGKSDKKVKGTIHWVSSEHAFEAEVKLYDRLFTVPDPESDPGKEFKEFINPESLIALKNCKLEPSLKDAKPGDRFQFERLGYFCVDIKNSSEGKPVFNRIVSLRDSWAKINKSKGKN